MSAVQPNINPALNAVFVPLIEAFMSRYPLESHPAAMPIYYPKPGSIYGSVILPVQHQTEAFNPDSAYWKTFERLHSELFPVIFHLARCIENVAKIDSLKAIEYLAEAKKRGIPQLNFIPANNSFSVMRLTANERNTHFWLMTDEGDHPWVVVTWFGEYTGGEIEIIRASDNGVFQSFMCRGQPGDVLLVKKGDTVDIAPFEGKRYQLEFFVANC